MHESLVIIMVFIIIVCLFVVSVKLIDDIKGKILLQITSLLFLWWVYAGIRSTYKFEPEDVADKIELVLGTSDYKILDASNNNIWVGTPFDVTYNILLLKDSTVVSCKCTDGIFQPRICRKYE